MSVNKKTNKEIKSEISRLQSEMAKRGQNKTSSKGAKKRAKVNAQGGLTALKSAPLNTARSTRSNTPSVSQIKDGCVVKHRELVMSVITPSNAGWSVLKRLRCNPGSFTTFAWLSTMANSWETYKFRKLRFHYIHRCSATTNGSFLVSPDYDAQDGAPSTEQLVSMYRDTVESSPWVDMVCDLKPQSMNRTYKGHYCMSDSRFATTTQDEKTIDAAQVFISADSDNAATWGKLWVDYEVEFHTPQPPVINTAVGGLNLSLTNGVPVNTNGLFQNAAADISINQDVQDPIAIPHNNPGAGSSILLQMAKDWSGRISTGVESSTGNFSAAKGFKMYKTDPITNVQTLLPFSSLDSHFTLGAGNTMTNDVGARNVVYNTQDAILKAGDLIGIINTGLENPSAALTAPVLRMIFGANGNF